MSTVLAKPNPTVTPVSEPFWTQASAHILRLQQCNDCQKAIFYPRRHCPHCWSESLRDIQSSGRGTVASIVEVHRPGHPSFNDESPYYVALIDLDEGVRMLSNVSDPSGAAVPVGASVELGWKPHNQFSLPIFTVINATMVKER